MRNPVYRDNRENILRASFEYLTANGLENISMRELCKGIGLSIGSVYYWFDNKENLIADTAEYGLMMVSDDIFESVFNNVNDFEEVLEGCFSKIDHRKQELRVIYQLACSSDYGAAIRKFTAEFDDVYNEYSAKLADNLGYDAEYVRPLCFMFVSAVLDYAIWEDKEKTRIQLDCIYNCLKKGI